MTKAKECNTELGESEFICSWSPFRKQEGPWLTLDQCELEAVTDMEGSCPAHL